MQIKTLSELTGKFKVVVTLEGDYCFENADKIAADIITQVEAQGGKAERKGDIVQVIGGTQYWPLPKLKKHREGVIEFRSSDYIFTENGTELGSFGQKPKKAQLLPDGFFIETYTGQKMIYTLIEKL